MHTDKQKLDFIRDYLNFDKSVLPHLEATYYTRESQLQLKQHELCQLTQIPPEQPKKEEQYTLDDYNTWRQDHLAVASVEEKLKWNQIRRTILEQTNVSKKSTIASESVAPIKGLATSTVKTQRICELIKDVAQEQSDLQKLWTEIVNYRAQISLANSLRTVLAEHNLTIQ